MLRIVQFIVLIYGTNFRSPAYLHFMKPERAAPLLICCISILFATVSFASPKPAESAAHFPHPEAQVPLIHEPLHLSDFDGMQPRAELRPQLGHITDFIQTTPKADQLSSQPTEVWMARTDSTLYFVFICYDSHTNLLRSHLARREDILYDDRVSVLLDPFRDHRKGVLFMVNPAGVQADAEWTDNVSTDYSYDQVWDSEGRITSNGWMALVAIPFRSLRFPATSGDWGVVFTRNYPLNNETARWPRVSDQISGTLTQEGTLHDVHSNVHSHNLQIAPYTLGQSEHTLENSGTNYPSFSTRRAEATAGGELKYVMNNGLVFDATLNPDFSDVESDTPQFTVNQRYPVSYSELRPFFLEHANFFNTPIDLLYTRTIVNPEFGSRLTGKVGHTNLGLLVADDRNQGRAVAPGDSLYGKRALIAVGRLSRDIGKSSSVGLIYTDREFGDGWNRVGGVDFTAQLSPAWTANGQMVVSSTMGDKDSGTPPTYTAGPASYLEVYRSGHVFSIDSYYLDYSRDFTTSTGYVQTSNIRSGYSHAQYMWYPKSSSILSWGLETTQQIAFDHAGNRVYHYSTFDPFVKMPRNTTLAIVGSASSDTVGPQNGYAMQSNRNFTENNGSIVVRSSPITQLYLSLQLYYGGNVNYNPVSNAVPSLLRQQTVQLTSIVQPIHPLTFTSIYLLDRDFRDSSKRIFVYESQTMRTKINYQFTRALSARVIAQYATTLVNPDETSLQRTKQIASQALLAWLPHPGTGLYLGYNNDLQNLDRKLCNRLSSGACDSSDTTAPRSADWLNDGRRFFIKASYQLRF